jgi:hypothetical protein
MGQKDWQAIGHHDQASPSGFLRDRRIGLRMQVPIEAQIQDLGAMDLTHEDRLRLQGRLQGGAIGRHMLR